MTGPTPRDAEDAARDARPALVAFVEERDDAPDVCTLYPRYPEDERRTEWLSAEAGSYVALDAMR